VDNLADEQESQALILIVPETMIFNGKPLVVMRLPDGRPGVVLRWICANLHIDPAAQVGRIKRTEVITNDLVYTQVQTDVGPQVMPALVLHAVPYGLATIDTRRMEKESEQRLEILHYQRKGVDALYAWAASAPKVKAAPTNLVPAEPITKPTAPAEDASLDEWREYHRHMVLWIDWQHDIERWRGSVESRLEGLEAVTDVTLERLEPEKLTAAHQEKVQQYVEHLCEAAGKHRATIYTRLHSAFKVPR